MKKALITGMTGMVGSHLANFLLANTDWDIYGMQRWRSAFENIAHLSGRINDGDRVFLRYGDLNDIQSACELLIRTFTGGGRLYICGNGGSAADALHIAGELVKSFVLERPLDKPFVEQVSDGELIRNLQGALPAFALVENTALATAFSNDCAAEYVFAQQVYAYARHLDCVWGISTSGNSKNVIHALKAAKGRGAATLGLAGDGGGEMEALCDACICVPETETYKVQELHLPVYHSICLALEDHFWGG